jgi:hypothetical protein
MCQEVVDRDLVPSRRRIGHVLLDRIVERQLASLREQQDRRSRELFRNRAEAELRGG